MNCSKCKKEVKEKKTKYGRSYECPCGDICIHVTGDLIYLTPDNNLDRTYALDVKKGNW